MQVPLKCWNWALCGILMIVITARAQIRFDFDGDVGSGSMAFEAGNVGFVKGIDGRALSLSSRDGYEYLELPGLTLDGSHDFSVQFWIKTRIDRPMAFLTRKDFSNKGIGAQKNPGWAIYGSGGTFAWCVGSGERRINYERDNGDRMPVSDGRWHQLTLTYSRSLREARLYYDGRNAAVYHIGFEFGSSEPLRIGTPGNGFDYDGTVLPEIEAGAVSLQAFVDEFNRLGAGPVKADEFIGLIVDPERLYAAKIKAAGGEEAAPDPRKLEAVLEARKKLLASPYTVFQNRNLTLLKPVSRIYALKNGRVVIRADEARRYTRREQLHPADFAMDRLVIRDDVLDSHAVMRSFGEYRKARLEKPVEDLKSLTVGIWNIWHGGIHWTREKDGWDSRLRIVEILKKHAVDVLLMQETYSSGDFIAAELGYYFATTTDRDYCFQGSNISVISRFPIKELYVPPEAEFNNVAVKLAVGDSREIYAMSNWYGMSLFPKVYAFHRSRFDESDRIPVFFGGDFNAVPHTDGGDSPASVTMLDGGFTDAFRSRHPDVRKFPGRSHRSGHRIDQLYYKGKEWINTSTVVISDWPEGFPSDHYLIKSTFLRR